MYVCWGYNAHGGCHRGATCPNVHQHLKAGGLHRDVLAELYRRGGHKSVKGAIVPQNINGRAQELRESNVRKETGGCLLKPRLPHEDRRKEDGGLGEKKGH